MKYFALPFMKNIIFQTFFCKKLSQKVRNIRWKSSMKKRRAEGDTTSPTQKKARRFLNMAAALSTGMFPCAYINICAVMMCVQSIMTFQ